MKLNYRVSTNLTRFFVYVFLVILLVVTVIPIWLLIVNGTRSTVEIQQGISMLPSTHLVENYNLLISKGLNVVQGFTNSLIISVSTTILSVYFSLLTAYGLVAYNFKGKKFLYNSILVLVLIPMQLSIIGFFHYMSQLGLTDSYLSLILPSIASAGSVFFAK
ncbi:MAG: carbohydrate ABC transporter permease, partial [Anaerolineaceae bacterium]|nr:carbohydrate ABC transporter permease [Anaerolineaceae bacterium]